ncbi:MAG: helix-turn-helix domain-containing protein [Leptothrix sp. (in: b-proteobacteria)]
MCPLQPPPSTIGEHLYACRSGRKLRQKEVAATIGVSVATIAHWEKDRAVPSVGAMPAIVRFLGYDPTPEAMTLSDRMRSYRLQKGLSIREVALQMGVSEDTWGAWERTGLIAWERYRVLLDAFLTKG